MLLSLASELELTTCKTILERIKARAIARFGEKWMAGLVKEYVDLAILQGDEKATVVSRRSQLERVFERGSCNADKLIMLAAAVGCRFQMVCTQTIEEIEDL
jgi:hypothetical protein